jgi:hypothetical protein
LNRRMISCKSLKETNMSHHDWSKGVRDACRIMGNQPKL